MDLMKFKDEAREAKEKLEKTYGTGYKFRILMSTWLLLQLYEPKEVRDGMVKMTYYRHLRWLNDAGIEINGRIPRPQRKGA